MFLGVDAVLVNVKASKIEFLTSPGTFCTFHFETIFRQYGKCFMDMHDRFRQDMAANYSMVEVHDDEFALHWLHNAVQYAHELDRCVPQAKWQDSPLIQIKFCGEGRHLPVSCCNTNFMVNSRQVQFCEPVRAVP